VKQLTRFTILSIACAITALVAGCATSVPDAGRAAAMPINSLEGLFDERVLKDPIPRVTGNDLFTVSDEMRRYINSDIAPDLRQKGRAQALFDALYQQGALKLDYDASVTRNARDTFIAKSGNCLALTIMTAAFAKEMGLYVRFQSIPLEEQWTRVNGIFVASGHVNITLSGDPSEPWRIESRQRMTIDFFPPGETRGRKPRPINEARIVAMYMNNRAAETLMQDRLSEAFAWAREAIRRDPDFTISHNTLGVIYRRLGAHDQAARVFEYVLAEAPDHLQALSNLAVVRTDQGRTAEAQALRARLAQLQPDPPYHYFEQGVLAYRQGQLALARELFSKEVRRAAYNAEFHFWLALTHLQLGAIADAQRHLGLALENSTTPKERMAYGSKLKQLRTAVGG
jgi:Tfp pilus assembly protein PilF